MTPEAVGVSGGPAVREDDLPLPAVVDRLVRIAAGEFSDLGYLAADGLLDLPVDRVRALGIRIEVPAGQALQLQSIGIDTADGAEMTQVAHVRASSWPAGEEAFDPAILFDIDRPLGAVIQTEPERPGWAEVRFDRPLALTRVRLRNVSDEHARQARGIKLSLLFRWRSRVIYDGSAPLRKWRRLVNAAKAEGASEPGAAALLDVLDLTVRGDYGRAHRSLAARVAEDAHRRAFRSAVNEELLPSRGLEWTVHGPRRPFRSWSEQERIDYVQDGAGVVEALQKLTPNACFGFGSVLAVVRDGALIPHDDDVDIIVGFEAEEAKTVGDGLRLVEGHMRRLGYEVTGGFAAHRHIRRHGRKHVDVFVGIFEGETISWYPGARGGLTRPIVFPPSSAELLGIPCPIPAQPEIYLERLYGPTWRVPDPFFSHRWDTSAYADILGRPEAAPDPDGPRS